MIVGFDLDMTLIDSRPQVLASFAALAAETGVAIDLDVVNKRLGAKLEDEIGHWFPPADREAATAGYRRHYLAVAAGTAPLPGAAEAIAAVRAGGGRAVVITAKHLVSVGPSLAAAGLDVDEVFAFVHGAEKAAVLRELGAFAYVGDTPADVAAAVSAGSIAVGVATGSYPPADLRRAGADVVLDALTGFASWYKAVSTS